MSVTFWGVRGTVPTPGTQNLRYGGNTSCVELQCGEKTILFDAGTGLYPCGEQLKTRDLDILLSHTHIDHIMGFPFFSEAYNPECTMRLWAGHLQPEHTLREILSRLMSPPIFPLTLDHLKARLSYNDFTAGEVLQHEAFAKAGITVRTLPLKHPDRATAYRVEYEGLATCYVTDVEHRDEQLDEQLLKFIDKADFFIYDSTFDDRSFGRFKGWGHSTWQHAVRLGVKADVGTIVLFHHDPGANDEMLDARLKELSTLCTNAVIAREGLTLVAG